MFLIRAMEQIWKMKCTIQLGFVSLNGTFHLSPNENICIIALINIHYLYNKIFKCAAGMHFVSNCVWYKVCWESHSSRPFKVCDGLLSHPHASKDKAWNTVLLTNHTAGVVTHCIDSGKQRNLAPVV